MDSQTIFQVCIYFSIIIHGVVCHLSSVEHNDTVFKSWSEKMLIVHVNPITLIRSDNQGEHVMGVSDDKCDNARV